MNIEFESIQEWNGQNDTGRDARLKLDRNFQKVNTANAALDGKISAEATTRQTNDNTLDGKITAEATARQTNDNTLQQNITSEATIRQTNDNTLQSNINALQSSTIAGSAAITNSFPVYNVTVQAPPSSGYYAAATARAAVPTAIRKKGLVITYAAAADNWITEQFFQGEVSAWTTASNWNAFVHETDLGNFGANMDAVNTKLDELTTLGKYRFIASLRHMQFLEVYGYSSGGTIQVIRGNIKPGQDGKLESAFLNHYHVITRTKNVTATGWTPWTEIADDSGIQDAPLDGNRYVRLNGAWVKLLATINVNASQGVNSASGGGIHVVGTTVTVSCLVDNEYDFYGWYNENNAEVSRSQTYSFTAADRTLTAKATEKPTEEPPTEEPEN
jgi:hypothetical protein